MNCKGRNIAESHIKLQDCVSEDELVNSFIAHQNLTPWNLLRRSIESICNSAESYLRIKDRFAQSYACLSICSYILGIGDRHLENFLFNFKNGSILGIDFGIAFDSGIHLQVPELMPFRLTRQIEGAIAPVAINGTLKSVMCYCLDALKKKNSLIIDYCDIFVKDPLLDWVKAAKSKNVASQPSLEMGTDFSNISWYPMQKMDIVKLKLSSKNPQEIFESVLRESRHGKEGYYRSIVKAVRGHKDSLRGKYSSESILSTEQQVECLIDQSRDPSILGRTWIGWAPQI